MTAKSRNLKTLLTEPVNILLIIMLFARVIEGYSWGRTVPGVDFYQFWVVGQALETSQIDNIYSDSASRQIGSDFLQKAYEKPQSQRQLHVATLRKTLETYSTPFLYAVFHLFATGSYETDLDLFNSFSLILALIAIAALCRFLGYTATAALSAMLFFVGWFDPFMSDVRVANVGRLELALLALFLWFQTKPHWRLAGLAAGVILGFAVMFKPDLIFVAALLFICWLINRRYRKLLFVSAGILISAVIAFAGSSIFLGSVHCWKDWVIAVRTIPHGVIPLEMGNYAPIMLFSASAVGKASTYLAFLFTVMAAVFVFLARRSSEPVSRKPLESAPGPDRAFFEDLLMVAIGCLIYLLSAPFVPLRCFVLVVPGVLFAFRRPQLSVAAAPTWQRPVRQVLAAVAVVGLTIGTIAESLNITSHRLLAAATAVSTVILFALALWEIMQLRTNEI